MSEGEVERNHVLSELSRVGSIYPRPSQSLAKGDHMGATDNLQGIVGNIKVEQAGAYGLT
jgi:hypothetical protein